MHDTLVPRQIPHHLNRATATLFKKAGNCSSLPRSDLDDHLAANREMRTNFPSNPPVKIQAVFSSQQRSPGFVARNLRFQACYLCFGNIGWVGHYESKFGCEQGSAAKQSPAAKSTRRSHLWRCALRRATSTPRSTYPSL